MSDDKSKPDAEVQVPKAVVSRLSLYLRELQRLVREGEQTISSTQLGALLGFTDAQVRKDLAYFGQFGYPGIGYRCQELIQAIKQILGTNQSWGVALIGVGNLGRALAGYRGFAQQGFKLLAAFDVDASKVSGTVEGVPVFHHDQLAQKIRDLEIRLAILAVPASVAQSVADSLVAAGIEGILNFAPVTITVPTQVRIVGVDLAMELEQLSFSVAKPPKE